MPTWSYLLAAMVLGILGLMVLMVRRNRTRAGYYHPQEQPSCEPVRRERSILRTPVRPSLLAARNPFLMKLPEELDSIMKGLEALKQGRAELLQEFEHEGDALALRFKAMEEGLLRLEQDGKAALEAINLRLGVIESGLTKGQGRGKNG